MGVEKINKLVYQQTLYTGEFDFYQTLALPFVCAAYIMFLISEVHPFLDGNGRMARVMMNEELVNQRKSWISFWAKVIPIISLDFTYCSITPELRFLKQANSDSQSTR
jgi:hypothetical protein